MEEPVLKFGNPIRPGMRLVTLIIFSMSVLSCGLPTGDPDEGLDIDPYETIDGDFTTAGGQLIDGTGTVLFATISDAIQSKTSFWLSFQLLEDNASLALVGYADSNLENGFRITFRRDGIDLKVEATEPDGDTTDLLSDVNFESFAATDNLAFRVQIENDSSQPELTIWREDVASFEISTSSWSSLDGDPEDFSALSSGNRWGIVISNTRVSRAVLNDPIVE